MINSIKEPPPANTPAQSSQPQNNLLEQAKRLNRVKKRKGNDSLQSPITIRKSCASSQPLYLKNQPFTSSSVL